MTNAWTDIGNSSCVIVWGANPAENHPAAFAHINKARANGAKLVVIDPRRTRTALQADRFIRMRPGTDMALQNAVIRGIIARMEAGDPAAPQFYKFLNQGSPGTFYGDGSATTGSAPLTVASGVCSKYTDARFLVAANDSDYLRGRILADGTETAAGPDNTTISNFPLKSSDCRVGNTVYNRLKAHVQPYDPATVAAIVGCTEADIAYLIDVIIANSRCSSVADVLAPQDPRVAGYKVATFLYAMGMTQHTNASLGIKGFANIQTLMGNMGRAGGGINAMRGIHNVQGSTDMGLLFGNIPAYSGNPSKMTAGHAVPANNDPNAFGKYMDALWGTPLSGTGNKGQMNGSYDDAYTTGQQALQQRGFYNMTRAWYGDTAWATVGRTNVDGLYNLWPKGNGDDHITMFRQMAPGGYTKALLCWGQNPAVTEPNQSHIRAGLENLDTLVVVDIYETETAAAKRKATGVTYLIPASSHVEEAGSVTNSARTLQWRERCTLPKGNTKADMELLLRLAYALDKPAVDAFAHIKAEWTAKSYSFTSAYDSLYGTRFGWSPAGATAFEDVTFSDPYTQVWTGTSGAPSIAGAAQVPPVNGAELRGSEAICERVSREMYGPVGHATFPGTLWIYTGGFNTDLTSNNHPSIGGWQVYNRAKSRDNRDGVTVTGTKAFGGWGYSWLVNRRVFYNNGDVPGDVSDFFMGPDSVSRLFVSTNSSVLNYSRWYRTIHKLADMPDVCLPTTAGVGVPTATHIVPGRFPSFTEPYETPRANDAAYMAKWGRNTKGTAAWDLVKSNTNIAAPGRSHNAADFPLVLTTIRCVEHFQGGPLTRNNEWNVEAEPEPWIEINPVDARTYGIVNGDLVNVVTARSNSTSDQEARATAGAGWAKGFRARVDSSIAAYQRVGVGVVAIPWHWGERGVGTGSRANDLTIDAADANTVIPEYKACLCRIEKA